MLAKKATILPTVLDLHRLVNQQASNEHPLLGIRRQEEKSQLRGH